jgi:hypothetical protein
MGYSLEERKRGRYGLEVLKEQIMQRLQEGSMISSIDHCRLSGNRSDYMTSTEITWENDSMRWSIISETGNGDNLTAIIRYIYIDLLGYDLGEAAYREISLNVSNVTRVKDVKHHHGRRNDKECFTVS